MDATANATELANALERFQQLLDPDSINAKQDYGPATIYTPWVVVWLLVYQRLHGNATLQEAVGELFRLVDHLPVNRRVQQGTLSGNTAAYSRARTRLEVSVCEEIADHVFDSLMETTPPTWQQRRVFLIDGTTTKLCPNKVLQRLYPPASNQHGAGVWPILHWAVAHELSSGCAVRPETGAMYGPEAVSEVTLASRLIRRLPTKSVLLADRNFGVLAFHYAATQAGHDVVSRLTESRFRSMVRRATAVGPGRWQLDWRPTRAERRKHPEWPADVCVRVHLHEQEVVTPSGQKLKLWLVTTLSVEGAVLAEFYRQRLNVETDIRDVKVALSMNELRGHSAEMLAKELALGMVAYSLVVQVRRLAARQRNLEPRRLSFTGVWSLVRTVLLSPNEWTLEEWVSKFEWVLRGAGQRKLPNRPNRSFPRQIIPRGRRYAERPRPK
jgi:hypothetical protein